MERDIIDPQQSGCDQQRTEIETPQADTRAGQTNSVEQPEPDYELGYKKPPKASQFKKGQSGNRRGRPRGSQHALTTVEQALGTKITVAENGRRRKVSKAARMFEQLATAAAEGDPNATQTVLRLLQEYKEGEPVTPEEAILNELGRLILVRREDAERWPDILGTGYLELPRHSEEEEEEDEDEDQDEDAPVEQQQELTSKAKPRPKTLSELFWEAILKSTKIGANGRRRVSKLNAMFEHLADRASAGDSNATRIVLRLNHEAQRRAAKAAAAKAPEPDKKYFVTLPYKHHARMPPERWVLQDKWFALRRQRLNRTGPSPAETKH